MCMYYMGRLLYIQFIILYVGLQWMDNQPWLGTYKCIAVHATSSKGYKYISQNFFAYDQDEMMKSGFDVSSNNININNSNSGDDEEILLNPWNIDYSVVSSTSKTIRTKSGCDVNVLEHSAYGCNPSKKRNWKPFINGKPKDMSYVDFCQLQCQRKRFETRVLIDKRPGEDKGWNWHGCKGWLWTGSECILKQCSSSLQPDKVRFSETFTAGVPIDPMRCKRVTKRNSASKSPTTNDGETFAPTYPDVDTKAPTESQETNAPTTAQSRAPTTKSQTKSPTKSQPTTTTRAPTSSETDDGYFEGPKMPNGPSPPYRYNFLIMVADDMSSAIWPYVESTHVMRDATPSLNRLMDTSTVFFNAYIQFSVCGPSRQSMMSGRLPDTTKIYNFERWLPQVSPNINTFGKYFVNNGYDVQAIGKIFHDNNKHIFGSMWADLGHFSSPVKNHFAEGNLECGDKWYCESDNGQLVDAISTNLAVKYLRDYNAETSKPFMLLVGFRRPHISVAIPKSTRQRVSNADVDLPSRKTPPQQSVDGTFKSSLAYFECGSELWSKKVLDNGQWSNAGNRQNGLAALNSDSEVEVVRDIRSYYYKSLSWIDSRVGLILDQLEESKLSSNTVVIFMSDHGFSNGEHGMWCKNSLFEQVLRIPFVMRVPGIMGGVRNRQTHVSAIDLFPTLIDLAGLPPFDDGTGIPLDGKSFMDALKNPQLVHSVAAYSQYPRCKNRGAVQDDACVGAISGSGSDTCNRNPILYMGYSIRIKECRYTEWRQFEEVRTGCSPASWDGMPNKYSGLTKYQQLDTSKTRTRWDLDPVERELYCDYADAAVHGDWENTNLAIDPSPGNQDLMNNLSNMIVMKYRDGIEACSGHGILDVKTNNCACAANWLGDDCSNSKFD